MSPHSDARRGDTAPLVALRQELLRLRGGRALGDPANTLRLGDGFWSGATRGERPATQVDVVRVAAALIKAAISRLDGELGRVAAVEFNIDARIRDSDLGRRQQSLADELGYSVKTIRRRGNTALYALALQLHSAAVEAPSGRSGAEAEPAAADGSAAVALERFWGIGSRQRVDIVCSELPHADRPYYANPRDRNYLRYAKFADLDSLVYVRTRLAQLFPDAYVRDFSASEYFDSHADHLVVLGGPDWNAKAGEFQENLPIKFFWDEQREATYVAVEGEPLYPEWSPTGALVREYAMFARFRLRQGLLVNLMWGCVTYGVLAASQCFLDVAVAPANIGYAERLFGPRSFAVLLAVREFGGIVQPPDLKADCVARYVSASEFSANFERLPDGAR